MTTTSASPTRSGRRTGVLGEVLRSRTAIVGLGIIVLFVAASLFAPVIAPYSTRVQSCAVFEPPSAEHWLGCDDGGIDMLSLVLAGGQVSMIVGVVAASLSVLIGATVGLAAGYFGGWLDSLLMRITDFFLVIPQLVLMIVIAAVWGPSLPNVILVIGLLIWTGTARIVRSQVKSLRERPFVRRAESLGAGHWHIISRHLLPQVGPLLVANAVLAITVAVFNETALAFLGLSDPSAVTWGSILEQAFRRAAVSAGAWWAIVPAGLAVAFMIMGCYMFGRAIEDSLNPRLRVSYLSPRTWTVRRELPADANERTTNGRRR